MTVPLAIIAGIPLRPYQRSRWKPKRAGWKILVFPANAPRRADLNHVWNRVMDTADKAPQAGAHLLLAHDHENERPLFKELVTRSYRATWLPPELSPRYGSPEFQTAIEKALLFEESWRDRVRPDIDSPLLLPETSFTAEPSVSDLWDRAREVHQRRDHLDDIENVITRFRKRHRKRDGWHDDNRLVFKRGTPHGGHGLPQWRSRKLTSELPPGFHFDVKNDRRNRRFQISDQEGAAHIFASYTNVDPHGFLRGGH